MYLGMHKPKQRLVWLLVVPFIHFVMPSNIKVPPPLLLQSPPQPPSLPSLGMESIHMYRLGGYHPVNIGDTFKYGRYQVIRKLGHGNDATTWLCTSEKKFPYVVLHILTADESRNAKTSLRLSQLLSNRTKQTTSLEDHVLIPIDRFVHVGPNGSHYCRVYEPMATTWTYVSLRYPIPPRPVPAGGRLSPLARPPHWLAKRILRDTLKGLVGLHKLGIVHGNLHADLLHFAPAALNITHKSALTANLEATSWPSSLWIDDTERAPRFLVQDNPLDEYLDLTANVRVVIAGAESGE
jgi:hypothetical protein